MTKTNNGTKITLAVVNNEISHIKSSVQRIEGILTKGETKIADNRTEIAKVSTAVKYTWKIGGVVVAIVAIVASYAAAVR